MKNQFLILYYDLTQIEIINITLKILVEIK